MDREKSKEQNTASARDEEVGQTVVSDNGMTQSCNRDALNQTSDCTESNAAENHATDNESGLSVNIAGNEEELKKNSTENEEESKKNSTDKEGNSALMYEIDAVERDIKTEEQIPKNTDLGNPIPENRNLGAEKKKKRRNKILGYTMFILLNALVVAILLIVEDKSGDTAAGWQAISTLRQNLHFAVLAFGMFFVVIVFDTMVFFVLVKKANGNAKVGLSMKVSLLGRYYDRITPWSIGGEPFQIGFLMKGGLTGSNACAVTMSRHIVRFFTTAVVVVVILAVSGIATTVWVMVAAIISIMGGLILPIFMLICSFNPKLGHRIGKGVVTLLFKMKLVKDYDKQLFKMQQNVDKFLSGIKYLSLNKTVIIIIGISALVELFAMNAVPFLVMRALGIDDITFWKTLVLCIFVTYSASFAPTPGGAGIAELSFYAIFATHITGGFLFWAVLFWRIAVFYIPVFVGFFIQVWDGIVSILKIGEKKTKIERQR